MNKQYVKSILASILVLAAIIMIAIGLQRIDKVLSIIQSEEVSEATSEVSSEEVSEEASEATSEEVSEEVSEETFDISVYPLVEVNRDNNRFYQEAVKRKLASGEAFLTEEDIALLQNEMKGPFGGSYILEGGTNCLTLYRSHEATTLYYPVLFRHADDALVLWYSDLDGDISCKSIIGNEDYSSLGNLHLPEFVDDERFLSSWLYGNAYTYLTSTGEIRQYKYGQLTGTYSIPANSIYCGEDSSSHLFRSGEEVYLFNLGRLEKIADNVKCVVSTTYYVSHDFPECPLLLFTDGKLGVYCPYFGESDFIDPILYEEK